MQRPRLDKAHWQCADFLILMYAPQNVKCNHGFNASKIIVYVEKWVVSAVQIILFNVDCKIIKFIPILLLGNMDLVP